MGEAIRWSDADLDRLAAVTDDDVAETKKAFKAKAPRKIKRLLD